MAFNKYMRGGRRSLRVLDVSRYNNNNNNNGNFNGNTLDLPNSSLRSHSPLRCSASSGGDPLVTLPKAHEQWNRVQNTIIGLFNKRKLEPNELSVLQEHIRNISTTDIGPFLLDHYRTHLLPRGLSVFREIIQLEYGRRRLDRLERIWWEFYADIIPVHEAILFQVKRKGLTVRQTALVAFRDHVVLKLGLEGILGNQQSNVSPGIKHMLLLLQGIYDTYPPNENKIDLEFLVARVISPYMGFRGTYRGSFIPEIVSDEPIIAERRRSCDRRLSRPLSVQANHMDTLEKLFKSAVSRSSHESHY